MKVVITGGAGFIGSNVANSFLEKGWETIVYDNLSRRGVIVNLQWLQSKHGKKVHFLEADIKYGSKMLQAIKNTDLVVHLAGQVGVQTSIDDPMFDFMDNAYGTLNVLDAARKSPKKPMIIFASTNKVYGDMDIREPISEKQPLKFCTPYGCSKGAAEQYILDADKIYDLPNVVLRMSCIYGDRQFGKEEQGWLAHFMFSHIRKEPITIYGDGTQQRDALYIEDYVSLIHKLWENKDKVRGHAFNIGGGPDNVISVNRAIEKMAGVLGKTEVSFDDWRPADQHTYISDITKIKDMVGWEPKIGLDEGLERLKQWCENPI